MILGFDIWSAAAQKLGFSMRPRENSTMAGIVSLDGTIDGLSVSVRSLDANFRAIALTPPRTDLGLLIRPADLTTKIVEWFGKHDVQIGDAAFDRAFDVRADEAARAKALLTPALVAVLTPIAGESFTIDDEKVVLRRGAPLGSQTVEEITWIAVESARVARAVLAAREGVPGAAALASHVEAWRSYATAHGLAFASSPLSFEGRIGGAPVRGLAKRIDHGSFVLDLSIDFEPPLDDGLHVRARKLTDFLDALAGGLPSVKTGDAAFDGVFETHALDPKAAVMQLDPEVRAALLALHDLGEVQLDARGLHVTVPMPADPQAMTPIAERVNRVVEHIAVRMRAGPYRQE